MDVIAVSVGQSGFTNQNGLVQGRSNEPGAGQGAMAILK